MKRLVIVATAAAVLAAGSTAIASAALVDNSGVINACVGPLGLIRIVNVTTGKVPPCRIGEHPLSWNQTGPAGPPGAAGSADLSAAQMVHGHFDVREASDDGSGQVICPFGDFVATGGGFAIAPADALDAEVIRSVPIDFDGGSFDGHQPVGWRVDARNNTGRPFNGRTITVEIWVSCAPGDPRF